MNQKKVRLKDVAERAGVAVNTASMILNRRPNSWASKATEARVFQAAKDLDYQPNRLAVALRLGKFNAIGLVIPDLRNPYFARMAELLRDEIAGKGYDLVIESSRSNLEREGKCLHNIFDRQVDGVICFLLDNERHREFLETQFKQGKAMVAFAEATAESLPVDNISINFIPGMSEAFKLLSETGHRRIGYLLAVAPGQEAGDRPETFRKLMKKVGLPSENMDFIQTDPSISGARDATRHWLEKATNRPTAIIAHNDLAALGVIRAAADLGLRVPDDLSVIGVDNTRIGEHLPTAITSVGLPDEKMVRKAVDLLLKRLDDPKYATPQRTEFSTRLVIRESVTKPSSA